MSEEFQVSCKSQSTQGRQIPEQINLYHISVMLEKIVWLRLKVKTIFDFCFTQTHLHFRNFSKLWKSFLSSFSSFFYWFIKSLFFKELNVLIFEIIKMHFLKTKIYKYYEIMKNSRFFLYFQSYRILSTKKIRKCLHFSYSPIFPKNTIFVNK